MDHEGEDAHHGGAALVQLLGAKVGLLLGGGVADEPDGESGSGGEISGEGSLVLAPDGELKEADEEEDLRHTGEGDLVQGGNASGDILEADGEILGEVSGETESGRGPEVAEEGKHADAAVLELDETEALEALLVSVLQETKGIVESEGGLDAELLLEGIESGLGLGDLGGHKGGGRAEDGGKDGSGLHGSRFETTTKKVLTKTAY